MEKFDVSVILPIKSSSSAWFEDYFKKCIQSLNEQVVKINELIIKILYYIHEHQSA